MHGSIIREPHEKTHAYSHIHTNKNTPCDGVSLEEKWAHRTFLFIGVFFSAEAAAASLEPVTDPQSPWRGQQRAAKTSAGTLSSRESSSGRGAGGGWGGVKVTLGDHDHHCYHLLSSMCAWKVWSLSLLSFSPHQHPLLLPQKQKIINLFKSPQRESGAGRRRRRWWWRWWE